MIRRLISDFLLLLLLSHKGKKLHSYQLINRMPLLLLFSSWFLQLAGTNCEHLCHDWRCDRLCWLARNLLTKLDIMPVGRKCGALFRCRVTSKSTFNLNPEHLSPTKFWKGRVGRRTIAKPASLGGRVGMRRWHTCMLLCHCYARWLVMPWQVNAAILTDITASKVNPCI